MPLGSFNRRALLKATIAGSAIFAAPSIARSQSKRVLKFAPQADLAVIDPMMTAAFVTRNHAAMVFDTLYGVDENFVARPQMVAGHTIDNDGKTWRLTLREGLKFHDGTPVLARDAVASVRRWASRDGFGATLIGRTDELSAVSDKVIEFRLKRPFALLPDALGKPGGMLPAIMPERLAQTAGSAPVSELVGSGPFRFVASERMVGARAVYERFDGYVPRDEQPSFLAGGKVANFDRVEWITLPDAATAAAAIQAGEIDWWEQPSSDMLPVLKSKSAVRIELLETMGLIGMIRFNHLHPPFDNPAIRRALLAGINQSDYMTAIVGDDPSMWKDHVGFFQPDSDMANDAGMAVLNGPRDLAKVKRDLVAAGYKGERVVVMSPTDLAPLNAMSEVLIDFFKKVGINVDYQTMDWGSEVQRLNSKNSVEQGGWSCWCNYASGTAAVNPIAHTYLRGTGQQTIWGWPDLPKIEEMRDAWIAAADEPSRKSIARQIQAEAFETLPYLPLGVFYQPTAYRENLTGMLKGFPIFWNVRRV